MALSWADLGTTYPAATTTPSLTFSSTPNSGDIIVVAINTRETTQTMTTPPSGYTAGPSSTGTNFNAFTYWKVSDGTETSVGCTLGASSNVRISAVALQGAAGTLGFDDEASDATNVGTATTSGGFGSVTTTENDAGVCAILFMDQSWGGTDPTVTSYTNTNNDPVGSTHGGIDMFTRVLSATGTETPTWSGSGDIDQNFGVLLAFKDTVSGANEGSGTIEATGTLPGQGYASHYGSGSCSATGTLPGQGYASHYGSGSCSATGTLPGEGQAPTVGANEGSGQITGTGTLPGQGYASHYGSGTCEATGTLPGEGNAPVAGAAEGSGTIDGTGTLPGQGYAAHSGSGECSATGSLPGEGDNGQAPQAQVGGHYFQKDRPWKDTSKARREYLERLLTAAEESPELEEAVEQAISQPIEAVNVAKLGIQRVNTLIAQIERILDDEDEAIFMLMAA